MSFLSRFFAPPKKENVTYSAVEVSSGANGSDTDLTRQLQPPEVPGWPAAPERVENTLPWIVADIALILLPIAFIVLAILAYNLHGDEISDYGDSVKQAILLGPTLFPLAFAALGGRSLKKIALWRAEKGTTLGFLEHMIGSQSLVAALGHAITLHSLDFLTLSLLILWALSPLGGQSALRLLYDTNKTVTEIHPIFYADVDAASEFTRQSYNEDAVNFVSAIVSTGFSTIDTLEAAPLDPWNHPKVPRFKEIEDEESRNATETPWYQVDWTKNVSYASLTGVNVLNLRRNTNATFTLPYEYMYFNCDLKDTGVNKTEFAAWDFLSSIGVLNPRSNTTYRSIYNTTLFSPTGTSGYFINTYKILGYNTKDYKPSKLYYLGKNFDLKLFLYECSYNSVLVEANVLCHSDNCIVERVRRLRTPRRQRRSAGMPYDAVHDGYTNKYFLTHLDGIGGTTSIENLHPVDSYVYGNIPWRTQARGSLPETHNWTNVAPADMSKRLTRYLNTYWDSSRWMLAVTRNDPFAESPSTLNTTSGEPFTAMMMNKTDATISWQVPIYKRNAGWIACLIICSGILLLVGCVSLILSFFITAPDVFNYVSSFTRDNPYIDAPEGGSALCGAERARLLKRLKVQLGDVDLDKDVGYIALRSVAGEKDCQAGRVRAERMYK